MTFETDILGPKYSDLDFSDYVALHDHVVASEARAVLDLDFVAPRTTAENSKKGESEDEEEEDGNGGGGGDAELGVALDVSDQDDRDRDEMDVDVNEDDFVLINSGASGANAGANVNPGSGSGSGSSGIGSGSSGSGSGKGKGHFGKQKYALPASPRTPASPSSSFSASTTPSSSSTSGPLHHRSKPEARSAAGFPEGLEHYFATYIWTLIYFQDYRGARAIGTQYEHTTLFGVSALVTAATKSASKFWDRNMNDTLDLFSSITDGAGISATTSKGTTIGPTITTSTTGTTTTSITNISGIYDLPTQFPWHDPKRGGSEALQALVLAATNVFQKQVYGQIRDKFEKVRVDTVKGYLPVRRDATAEEVLQELNRVERESAAGGGSLLLWVSDLEHPEVLLVSPRCEEEDLLKNQKEHSRTEDAVKKSRLNELIKIASELEQTSFGEN